MTKPFLKASFISTDFPSKLYSRRRTPLDVFHNDPFKVNSYTFRYAEKPCYPVRNYRSPEVLQSVQPKAPPKAPPFETYYYNTKFQRRQQSDSKSDAEHRRQKLLESYTIAPTKLREPPAPVPQCPTNSPLLRNCCNREGYQLLRRSASVASSKPPVLTKRSPSALTFQRNSSSCAISIDINGLSSETDLNKSLRIKIEPDTCLQNNTDKCKTSTTKVASKPPDARFSSSGSFVIDKRLSKFVVPQMPTSNRSQKKDLLLARRLQVQEERQCMERLRQRELEEERKRVRLREESRRQLRDLERLQDRIRIKELEAERESQRVRELERETQLKGREHERLLRSRSMLTSMDEPNTMSSNLYRLASTDRLHAKAPCYVRDSEVKSRKPTIRPLSRSLSQSPQKQDYLARRNSGASNSNANLAVKYSKKSLHCQSTTCLDEPKLLNLHFNGVPISSNQPIHTRINNMPIRIITSQPTDDNLRFSVNRVRVSAPRDLPNLERRRSSSRASSTGPYNIHINVYADNPRTML